jgi:creatinine amidohydrolase
MMSDMSNEITEVRWHKLRRDEIAEAAQHDPVLLLPIGAIEQHGPHLPVDTDSTAVTTVAERAAESLPRRAALVLPTISWGLSPYWMSFPGTLTLRPATILALISDIGASVAAHGFRRMVIVNGHGGNQGIIGVAATQLADHGVRAYALSYWSLLGAELGVIAPGDHGQIGHAGQTETSIQLRLQPDLVHSTYRELTGWTDLEPIASSPMAGAIYAPPLPLEEGPTGVYGNAPLADAAIGERIIAMAAERLAQAVRSLPNYSRPTG